MSTVKRDNRHKLKVYQSPSNGRWKWAWYTNGRSIAISGYFYDNATAAETAFRRFKGHLGIRSISPEYSEEVNKAKVVVRTYVVYKDI